MSFTSDPDVDKAYAPSRSLPEGVFQANLDLYHDRSLEVREQCAAGPPSAELRPDVDRFDRVHLLVRVG